MKHPLETVRNIFRLNKKGLTSRKIALEVFGRESMKSTVNDYLNKYSEDELYNIEGPKILFIDLEIAPTLAAVFPRWKATVQVDGIFEEPYILTAAWSKNGRRESLGLHQTDIFSEDHQCDLELVEKLWELLDWADIVIAHNAGFDDGWCNTRFAYWGMNPPSPYKVICTLKALKKSFSLPSNSLDASTRYFELDRKIQHEGIGLWRKCMNGDVEAFDKMLEYNEGDIPTLEQLYYKVRPFMKNHPNVAMYYEDGEVHCNTCGSTNMEQLPSKFSYTNLSKFNVYRCYDCGSPKRTRENLRSKEEMQNTLMNT